MVDNKYKKEVSSVINLAKQKGKVKKYEEYISNKRRRKKILHNY